MSLIGASLTVMCVSEGVFFIVPFCSNWISKAFNMYINKTDKLPCVRFDLKEVCLFSCVFFFFFVLIWFGWASFECILLHAVFPVRRSTQ